MENSCASGTTLATKNKKEKDRWQEDGQCHSNDMMHNSTKVTQDASTSNPQNMHAICHKLLVISCFLMKSLTVSISQLS